MMLGKFEKMKRKLCILMCMFVVVTMWCAGFSGQVVYGQGTTDVQTEGEDAQDADAQGAEAADEESDTDADATQKSAKKFKYVRVGYYYSELFQEGMTDPEPKSGYAYEYMQKIADYNGWEYLYVYGEWGDLVRKLENGEIDVLCGISMTDEYTDKMLFPNYEMGTDRYVLYQHEENKIMDTTDASTFEGLTIGTITDSPMTVFLEDWLTANALQPTVAYYDSYDARSTDFKDNKIDGIVATDSNALAMTGYSPVVTVGEQPYYMVVTNSRKDLLRELNSALSTIQELEPYFMQSLQSDNYGAAVATNRLSETEQSWLADHSELKVGYLRNFMPYCDEKDGKAAGLMTDVFDAMIKQLNLSGELSVSYYPYDTYQQMTTALKNEEIDAVFPVGGGVWNMEQDGIDGTSAVVTSSINLVYSGMYGDEKFQKIALCSGNKLSVYYVAASYPDSEIVECDSVEACLDKVMSGEATATIVDGLRSEIVNGNDKYAALSLLQLEKLETRSIGVKDGNYALLLLLNRGVRIIGRDYGINSSYHYVDDLYEIQGMDAMKNYIKQHLFASLAIMICVILFFAFCIFNYIIKVRERKMFKEQACLDSLTKLENRLPYGDQILKLDRDGVPAHFVYASIDINSLKPINDRLGHVAGDELINGAASIIKEVFGKKGKIYRTGGDEFIVMFKANEEEFAKYKKELTMATRRWAGAFCRGISLAVGYARKDENPNATIHELAMIADDNMYADKEAYYAAHGLTRR